METQVIETWTFRMQSGRSTTDLYPLNAVKHTRQPTFMSTDKVLYPASQCTSRVHWSVVCECLFVFGQLQVSTNNNTNSFPSVIPQKLEIICLINHLHMSKVKNLILSVN